jgi:Baseplate J-like protein
VPLNLPNLDDLRWQDLMDEGRSLIPAWAPEWTNHNPSDPGITLVELFAYFSEKLMYQLNRISDKNVLEFLKLIQGPEGNPETDSEKDLVKRKRDVVRGLRQPQRAVCAADFELLTQAVARVARAKCVPCRNLESPEAGVCSAEAPGHITVVVLPENEAHPTPELLARIRLALEPARLLTTRLHVVGPGYLRVKCRLTIVARRGTAAEAAREAAIKRLKVFFDPRQGWFDGKGWPFGRSVSVSDVYRNLGELPGIQGVMPTRDPSGALLDELLVDPSASDRIRRNNRGEIESIVLRADELVEAEIDRGDISSPLYA